MSASGEAKLQAEVVKLLQERGIYFFSVPNEGAANNKLRTMQLMTMGLRPGASDLVLVLPWRVVFLELKDTDGVQSDNQKKFQSRVESLGHQYILCRSLDDVNKSLDKITQ